MVKELREPFWERRLQQGLNALEKTDADLTADRKGADWKVALVRHLRESSLILNAWIPTLIYIDFIFVAK